MNKKIILPLSLICLISFVACDNAVQSFNQTYTVIWQNYNGDILEIDRNVQEGSIPSFDSENPTKKSEHGISYTFIGWSPEISEVHSNKTYTAVYLENTAKYTITWKNEDGTILEIDQEVPYGSVPSYDGKTPHKDGDENVNYVFNGWTPSIQNVTCNQTYVATFTERKIGDVVLGIDPVLSEDENTLEYGFYPQKHVNDTNLISQLNAITTLEANGWVSYNGNYYMKESASVYNNETYTFDDGVSIINGEEYWFKCDPIKWQVLSNDNGTYYLLSSTLLDAHSYYTSYENRTINNKTIYANNYEYSDLRSWLNNDFFNIAFAFNNSYVQETTVNNTASTTDAKKNTYACSNTKDKVYLPSYQDYLNLEYGFDDNASNAAFSREAKTSDFARARGAWCNTRDTSNPRLKNNGSYWTRSPSSEYYYCAWNVNSGGYLSTYAVDGNSHCVRPSISIRL